MCSVRRGSAPHRASAICEDSRVRLLDADLCRIDDEVQVTKKTGFFEALRTRAVGVADHGQRQSLSLHAFERLGHAWHHHPPQRTCAAGGPQDWSELRYQLIELERRQRRQAFGLFENRAEIRVKQAPIGTGSGDEHTLGVTGTRRGFGPPERIRPARQSASRELGGNAIEVNGDQRVADVEKDCVDVGVRHVETGPERHEWPHASSTSAIVFGMPGPSTRPPVAVTSTSSSRRQPRASRNFSTSVQLMNAACRPSAFH